MKFIILDDHRLFADGIGKIVSDGFPQSEILIYQSILKLKESDSLEQTDLLISDIELPEEDIFEFFEYLNSNYPELKVLVVSMHNKLSVIKKCVDLGVEGYVLKDDLIDFKQVISKILAGELYLSEKVKETYDILSNPNSENLSPREEEVLEKIAEGKSIDQIADQLFLSALTIKTHIRNIKQKLNLSRTSELIVYYFKNYIG